MASTMGNCRDCKHWDQGDPTWPWGSCSLALTLMGESQAHKGLAFARDEDRKRGWLQTSADFGCVQWAAKKEGGDE